MFKIKMECPELDKLTQRLKVLPKEAQAALQRSFTGLGEEVATEAKRRVPVHTGTLKGSILAETTKRGSTIRMEVGAGGEARGYALYVHENLKAYHPSGEAKFIERPLTEKLSKFDKTVAGDLDRAVQEILF